MIIILKLLHLKLQPTTKGSHIGAHNRSFVEPLEFCSVEFLFHAERNVQSSGLPTELYFAFFENHI